MKTLKPIYKDYEFDCLVANLQMKDERYDDMFIFVESDEPTLTDDMYELKDNDNIYIQCSEIGYIVNLYVIDKNYESGIKSFDESYVIKKGVYKTLEEAKAKCILLNNQGETNERILLYVYIKFDKCALYYCIIIKSSIKRFGGLVSNSITTYSSDIDVKING